MMPKNTVIQSDIFCPKIQFYIYFKFCAQIGCYSWFFFPKKHQLVDFILKIEFSKHWKKSQFWNFEIPQFLYKNTIEPKIKVINIPDFDQFSAIKIQIFCQIIFKNQFYYNESWIFGQNMKVSYSVIFRLFSIFLSCNVIHRFYKLNFWTKYYGLEQFGFS